MSTPGSIFRQRTLSGFEVSLFSSQHIAALSSKRHQLGCVGVYTLGNTVNLVKSEININVLKPLCFLLFTSYFLYSARQKPL